MPFELPGLKAGGTIRVSRFVKPSTAADNEVLEADANESILGISSDAAQDAPIPSASANAAVDGDQLKVNPIGSVCLLLAGTGGWTAGAEIKSDADGKGVLSLTTGTTLQNVGAIGHAATAAGEYGFVTVVRHTRRPAIA